MKLMSVYMCHVCMYTCTCKCVYVHVCMYMYVCMYVRGTTMYICTHVHVDVSCTCVCMLCT